MKYDALSTLLSPPHYEFTTHHLHTPCANAMHPRTDLPPTLEIENRKLREELDGLKRKLTSMGE